MRKYPESLGSLLRENSSHPGENCHEYRHLGFGALLSLRNNLPQGKSFNTTRTWFPHLWKAQERYWAGCFKVFCSSNLRSSWKNYIRKRKCSDIRVSLLLLLILTLLRGSHCYLLNGGELLKIEGWQLLGMAQIDQNLFTYKIPPLFLCKYRGGGADYE